MEDDETVLGQRGEIMSEDSPLLKRARARAAHAMEGTGLLNSSMAMGASEGALYDMAMPIASTDAQIRSQAAAQNHDVGNLSQRLTSEQSGANQQFNAKEAVAAAKCELEDWNRVA